MRLTKPFLFIAAIVAAAAVLQERSTAVQPRDDWQRATPESQGMSSSEVAQLQE
jgi:hypothetical protein